MRNGSDSHLGLCPSLCWRPPAGHVRMAHLHLPKRVLCRTACLLSTVFQKVWEFRHFPQKKKARKRSLIWVRGNLRSWGPPWLGPLQGICSICQPSGLQGLPFFNLILLSQHLLEPDCSHLTSLYQENRITASAWVRHFTTHWAILGQPRGSHL